MTGGQLSVLGGMLVAAGLVLGVRALLPAHPALTAALDQLAAEPATVNQSRPAPRLPGRWVWLPARVGAVLAAHLGVTEADLQLIGWTRGQLVARKLTLAAAGLLTPALISVLLILVGLAPFAALPAAAGLGIGAVGWLLPSGEVRERAAQARREFRSNLEFFLTLVAGERRARGSVEQALEEAVAISDSPPFLAMRRSISTALLSGQKPWRELRALGEQLQVPELRNLADIAEVAADGAAVYTSLLASARTLRHAELSDTRAEVNQISERMARPLALLVFGLTLFVLIPFMLRMLGGT